MDGDLARDSDVFDYKLRCLDSLSLRPETPILPTCRHAYNRGISRGHP